MSTTTPTASTLLGSKVTRYEDLALAPKNTSKEMGKQDFLTLFTAQLKNQDPLDPVKNEAFVAQLAQFSSLEALTNMQTSLDGFVKSMSANQMINGASLIGKKVSVADALTHMEKGGRIDASIDLAQGASGVTLTVQDSQGRRVQELVAGAQTPGTVQLSWDGLDAMGNPAPSGSYLLSAQAVVNGKNTQVPVQTMVSIVGANTLTDGTVSLQLDGGKTVLLKDVQRVGM
jgi:flagellar basal-body rod modification protein FlgD